jgi:CRP/FNR family transcriptional regulator
MKHDGDGKRTRHYLFDLWQTVPYLQSLAEPVMIELAHAARSHSYTTGQIVFNEGDSVFGLCLVETGVIKICRFSKEGREYILHLWQHGDTFNDVAAFDGGPNPATAIALTDAVVWCISRKNLRAIAQRHPELAWALLESVTRRTRYLVGIVQDLAMRSVRGRLAKLLIEQARAAHADPLAPLLTQDEMASRLGTVREVVGRALRSLADAGIIELRRHRIVILDEARLSEEAEV